MAKGSFLFKTLYNFIRSLCLTKSTRATDRLYCANVTIFLFFTKTVDRVVTMCYNSITLI